METGVSFGRSGTRRRAQLHDTQMLFHQRDSLNAILAQNQPRAARSSPQIAHAFPRTIVGTLRASDDGRFENWHVPDRSHAIRNELEIVPTHGLLRREPRGRGIDVVVRHGTASEGDDGRAWRQRRRTLAGRSHQALEGAARRHRDGSGAARGDRVGAAGGAAGGCRAV